MIKVSKHSISQFINKSKINLLDQLFMDYKNDLEICIDKIINGTYPLKSNLSSKLLHNEIFEQSHYKQIIYKQASEIIRSQIDKAKKKRFNKYKQVYSFFKKQNKQNIFTSKRFNELSLNDILTTKYFTKPNLNNISINLDERFFDIKESNHFDNFIKINLPYLNTSENRSRFKYLNIKVPLNQHKHSNELKFNGYELRKNIQLKKVNDKYFINLIWFKEKPELKVVGKIKGIYLGYKKLIVSSDNEFIGTEILKIYEKISNKLQGSKNFKQSLIERDNKINECCKQLDLSNTKILVIEDLIDLKKNKKYFTNKIQRWSYRKTIDKLESICNEQGIKMVKVSPMYTSQTCSKCGNIDKLSRNGETYQCVSCNYTIDADLNASINIYNKGAYSPFNNKIKTILKTKQ